MSEPLPNTAKLLSAIPTDRYTLHQNGGEAPSAGDIVVLDQGTVSSDGQPMCLVYSKREDGSTRYEALVFETELGPDI